MRVSTALFVAFCIPLSGALFADETVPAAGAPTSQTKPVEAPAEAIIPLAKDQQESLSKALLSKGLCNVAFFGEEFCAKQKTKIFKATDHFGNQGADQSASTEDNGKK